MSKPRALLIVKEKGHWNRNRGSFPAEDIKALPMGFHWTADRGQVLLVPFAEVITGGPQPQQTRFHQTRPPGIIWGVRLEPDSARTVRNGHPPPWPDTSPDPRSKRPSTSRSPHIPASDPKHSTESELEASSRTPALTRYFRIIYGVTTTFWNPLKFPKRCPPIVGKWVFHFSSNSSHFSGV